MVHTVPVYCAFPVKSPKMLWEIGCYLPSSFGLQINFDPSRPPKNTPKPLRAWLFSRTPATPVARSEYRSILRNTKTLPVMGFHP